MPKERFVSLPGCERDADRSPVVAWADWNALEQGRAVAGYFSRLFGSAARGEMTSASDLDLLVVKDKCHRRKTAARIYRTLPRPRPPVDVAVAWPEDLRRHKDSHWLVIAPALREGRTIYESPPRA